MADPFNVKERDQIRRDATTWPRDVDTISEHVLTLLDALYASEQLVAELREATHIPVILKDIDHE